MKAYMSLSCKTGAYSRVLNELLDLNIPREDIFLLFGPADVLVQFKDLDNLDEFIEKWFNPVRMIGADEALIAKTQTFVVISEGPLFAENPFAFVFLNTQPRNLENVRKALLTIPEVCSADTVFGPYDVICPIRAKDTTDLEGIVQNIQEKVPGIEGSMIAVNALMRI